MNFPGEVSMVKAEAETLPELLTRVTLLVCRPPPEELTLPVAARLPPMVTPDSDDKVKVPVPELTKIVPPERSIRPDPA